MLGVGGTVRFPPVKAQLDRRLTEADVRHTENVVVKRGETKTSAPYVNEDIAKAIEMT